MCLHVQRQSLNDQSDLDSRFLSGNPIPKQGLIEEYAPTILEGTSPYSDAHVCRAVLGSRDLRLKASPAVQSAVIPFKG